MDLCLAQLITLALSHLFPRFLSVDLLPFLLIYSSYCVMRPEYSAFDVVSIWDLRPEFALDVSMFFPFISLHSVNLDRLSRSVSPDFSLCALSYAVWSRRNLLLLLLLDYRQQQIDTQHLVSSDQRGGSALSANNIRCLFNNQHFLSVTTSVVFPSVLMGFQPRLYRLSLHRYSNTLISARSTSKCELFREISCCSSWLESADSWPE